MRDTYLWLLQLATGGVILVLGGAHLVLQHLDKILGFFGVTIGEPTSWASMSQRAGQGFWLAFYIAFLVLVLYHGLNGLRGVLVELTPSGRTQRVTTGVIIALGVVGLGLGVYVPADLFIS